MKHWVVIVAVVGCGVWAVGCGGDGKEGGAVEERVEEALRFENVAGADVGFVGDEACASCHEADYQGYQAHGMANSFYRLTPEHAVEDFGGEVVVTHGPSGFYYRPYREGDRFFQEEYRVGEGGQQTHRLVREMVYVVGSGTAARTYLAENNGRLYQMPLTWYTQARRWDFSPGYEVGNKRFDRLVPEPCMACHDSYPAAVPHAVGKYTDVPLGIGCERCHGPGALHVEARLADPEPLADIDPTIVNPAHLTLDRRLDVCQQCHLQTTVAVLRAGRTPFDFRPSQNLAEFVAFFAKEGPVKQDEIDVISHADRMKRSACFIETQGTDRALECVTCHNPHEGFRDKGPGYFNQTCLGCHPGATLRAMLPPSAQPDHTAEANCVACHMPLTRAEDTPHASFTDHWVRVIGDGPTPAPTPAHAPVSLTAYYDRDAEGPMAAVYEGMAYIVYAEQNGDAAAMEEGVDRLRSALAAQPDHDEAQYVLGYALWQQRRVDEAIPPLEAALRLNAEVPERLNTLAQAYEAAGHDPARIAGLYERALALQPALADVRVNYGRFLETQGRLVEAVAAYRAAIAEQPWLAVAHYNLGTALLRQSDQTGAEAALREAVALQPVYPEALANLGLLYATQGRLPEALAFFEQAVDVAPNHPAALGNLGAYYVNTGAMAEAIPYLRRAVAADPAYADALANLALAYLNTNDPVQARQYAQQALNADPTQALARQILAAL